MALKERGGGYNIAAGSGQPAANVLLDDPRGRCSRRWQVAGPTIQWKKVQVAIVVIVVVVVIDLLPSGLI